MDKIHKETDKRLARLEKEMNTIYNSTYKELEKKLNKIMEKIDTTQNPQKIYNQLQKKKRLETLMRKMTLELANVNKSAIAMLNNDLIDIYSDNYNWSAYMAEYLSGYDVDYTLYSRNVIKNILTDEASPFYMMAIKDVEDKTQIYKLLKRELTTGILQGESIPNLAKRLRKVVNRSYSDSVRIARTETTRVQNNGRLDALKKAESKGLNMVKVWSSTLDSRTRDRHRALDGQVRDLDKEFSNGLLHPGGNGSAKEVVNCRCSLKTEFKGLKKSASELKLDEALKNKKYEVWKDEHK